MYTSQLLLLIVRCIPIAIEVDRLIRTARADGRPVDRRDLVVCLAKLLGRVAGLLPDE
ncbi:hypothetical protein WMF39_17200 [Sorangium sp. So ce1504]|uniref:hypothetical protein n=1 Tax=Sorangium sp. So ce1504 TaxID=3133337 RepID=UPI003F5F61F5